VTRFLEQTPEERRARFEALLPDIRYAAWGVGYAIGVHGTLTRDMDLIAAPWIENAGSDEDLVRAVAGAVNGYFHLAGTARPHRRKTFIVYPRFHDHDNHRTIGYIDLSIMLREAA
jgi:hypothetical protein